MGIKEIEKMMIGICSELGIVPLSQIYLPDDFPEGPVDNCIVIHVKEQARGAIFYKGFVEVNVVIPDNNDRAEHALLEQVEKIMTDTFRYDTVSEYEGETYRYGLNSISVNYEPSAHYHYVNTRLLLETLNI